nr:hypothetical protein [Tanacetum cinerariifolium]
MSYTAGESMCFSDFPACFQTFKTLCLLNYALMIRHDYDLTSSLRRGALQESCILSSEESCILSSEDLAFCLQESCVLSLKHCVLPKSRILRFALAELCFVFQDIAFCLDYTAFCEKQFVVFCADCVLSKIFIAFCLI